MPEVSPPRVIFVASYPVQEGLCAWPVSVLFMEGDAATLAVTAYIIPFLISTVVGSIIAGVLVFALRAGGALKMMQRSLELK